VCGVQVFKRNGMDLIMKMDISLTEALCGMKKTVQTLDDRTLVMQTVPGRLILLVLISLISIFSEAVLPIRKT
jgi:DnaJ-class molecular chaperone